MDITKINTISSAIKSPDFSGVISVVTNNKVLIEDFNGYRDRTNKLLNDIDTRFAIASGTKLFTAIGIMKLIEEGILKLDDKVFEIVPNNFEFYDKNVTVKHLLTHTSGLPDYYDEELLKAGTNPQQTVPNCELLKPSDYLEIMPNTKMKSNPGEKFAYNNSAFVLLAILIEQLTGDYYKWIETKVLQPAKMVQSGFFKFNQLPNNTALGYIELTNGDYKTNIFDLPIIGSGDGGMFTTVADMNAFWDAFMKGKIVKKTTVNTMITPHSQSENLFYGLGVWLEKTEDGFTILLFGQDPGVSFESGYNPITNKKHTIISNTDYGAWKLSGLVSKL